MDTQHNPPAVPTVRRKGSDLQPGDTVYLPNQPEPVTLEAVIYVHSNRLRMFTTPQGKLTVPSFQWFCVRSR